MKNTFTDEGETDKILGSSYKLHAPDQETLGIYGKLYGIVDKDYRY